MFIPGAVGIEGKKRAKIRGGIFFGIGLIPAGPAHNDKIAGAEKLRIVPPCMNFTKRIKADNKKKLSGRAIVAAEMFDGVKGIGVAFSLQFAVGHLEERIVCSGNTHHLKAVPGGYDGIFFMRRHMGRDENNFFKAELLPYLLGRPQVPEMHRVECTAKKTYLHNACRASCYCCARNRTKIYAVAGYVSMQMSPGLLLHSLLEKAHPVKDEPPDLNSNNRNVFCSSFSSAFKLTKCKGINIFFSRTQEVEKVQPLQFEGFAYAQQNQVFFETFSCSHTIKPKFGSLNLLVPTLCAIAQQVAKNFFLL